jgi:hypothetical protein
MGIVIVLGSNCLALFPFQIVSCSVYFSSSDSSPIILKRWLQLALLAKIGGNKVYCLLGHNWWNVFSQ